MSRAVDVASEPVSPARMVQPPGPRGLPGVGVLPELLRDIWGYPVRVAREYGDVVTLPIPAKNLVLLSHPDHIKHILTSVDKYDHIPKAARDSILPDSEPALVMREGADWRRVRRVLNPRFTERSLAGISDLISTACAEAVTDWQQFADTGRPVELKDELAVVIMSALLRSMFSNQLPRQQILRNVHMFNAHGDHIVKGFTTRMLLDGVPFGIGSLLPVGKFPWPHLARGEANYRELTRLVEALIEARANRQEESDTDDLLDLLLSARFDDGSGFTRAELRSEVLGLIFAGFDTTAYALCWTVGLLALNPEPVAKAYAEVDKLGDGPITYEQLPELPYLRACFDEGQRLQGLPFHGRIAKAVDNIGGFDIPVGTFVAYSPYGVARDRRFWTDPDSFNPDRFLSDPVEPIEPFAFLPFGGGPRKCLGMRLAYIQGVLTLANLLRRYRFEVPDNWKPVHKYQFAAGMKNLPVTLTSR